MAEGYNLLRIHVKLNKKNLLQIQFDNKIIISFSSTWAN